MKKSFIFLAIIAMLISLNACKEEDPETGYISLNFEEFVDNYPLTVDTVKYTNEAGNEYLVTEVQYFISNIKLCYQDGNSYTIKQDDGIHYRDTDIPETRKWVIDDDVPVGVIDSIVFTFGLDEETNKTGLFPNPPESNMFWPEEIGGGYHYMKLNGKWMSVNSELTPFNFHLGIGQTYDTTGAITGFMQNYFKVNVYLAVYSSFIMKVNPGQTTDIGIIMNIDNWFKTPHTWDFDDMGGMMMQNQEKLRMACENGFDVFAVGPVYER
ncbi:MAG: hypothetical protein HGA23_11670 [Bacteroidales bacterium]|nr:hypothetical protein [Bacteroidales bacterium]